MIHGSIFLLCTASADLSGWIEINDNDHDNKLQSTPLKPIPLGTGQNVWVLRVYGVFERFTTDSPEVLWLFLYEYKIVSKDMKDIINTQKITVHKVIISLQNIQNVLQVVVPHATW